MSLTDWERFWLLALLVAWAVLLFGGFVFGKDNQEQTHRIPTWMRMGSSLMLVVAAWSWWWITDDTDWHQLALFIALGMTFGFLGDLLMAEVLSVGDRVIGGIGAFGLGHIAYITGLIHHGNRYDLDDPAQRWGSLAVWLVIGAIAWFWVVYRGAEKPEVVHYIALPYALLLAATAGFATGLALQSSAFVLLGVGGALFLTSDLLLAAQIFNDLHFRAIGDVVWLMYGPGQMLIVFSVPFTKLL
jgi:hypothetical protein